jgi:hypothetical protein
MSCAILNRITAFFQVDVQTDSQHVICVAAVGNPGE